jgi:hypothetical protein
MIEIKMNFMKTNCYFQIPRGNTNRYVYVFYYLKNSGMYRVVLKVLMANRVNYKVVSTRFIPQNRIMEFINTTVANTY